MNATLDLCQQLIAKASITPDDAGCQTLMIARLKKMGFIVTPIDSGEVKNYWAVRGSTGPLLAFAGHTDVVPTGPLEQWQSPPFEPSIRDGKLFGRGAADMKSSLAAMVVACEEFITEHPDHQGRIAFLVTSDEEGPATDGTIKVVEYLEQNNIAIDWCIVGEPSSSKVLGDVIKNGRRGSLNGRLCIHGHQGHIAYPQLADNPIHLAAPIINKLLDITWDKGNQFFPATSFQISNLNAGTGASNVIPGHCECVFNLRYSTEISAPDIQQRIESVLRDSGVRYTLTWQHSGEPFLTTPGILTEAVSKSIKSVTGIDTQISTSGGTSDGRFIAKLGCQIVECGPINASIHQIDEHIELNDIEKIKDIYKTTLELLFL